MKEDSEPFISSIDIGYIHKTARLESRNEWVGRG
jgi:hypothetical protein